jgi:excisionase family DNA binding protein
LLGSTTARRRVLPTTGPKYGLAVPRPLSIVPSDDVSVPPASRRSKIAGSAVPLVFGEAHHRMGSMALNELGKMLTAAEVAEMLHLHVNTVKRLGDRGELKYYRVCKRGDRRFLLEDVRRFLDQNR